METWLIAGLAAVILFSGGTFLVIPRLWHLADEADEAEKEKARRTAKAAHDEAVDGVASAAPRKPNDTTQQVKQRRPDAAEEPEPRAYRESEEFQPAVDVPPDFVLADYSRHPERD